MKMNKISCVVLVFLLLLWISVCVEARKNDIRKTEFDRVEKYSPADYMSTFDVVSFGAKGNGVFDDSKALLAAWEAACKVGNATVRIPAQVKLLINPITLQGPCMPHLTLQIDGSVVAPSEASCWPKSSLLEWINFKWVQNFTLKGSGIVDAQGSDWWTSSSQFYHLQKRHPQYVPHMKPTALRFYSCKNVTVKDIRIKNSPLCHLKFDSSKGIIVNNITISSPENSPNTDGIHLQNSVDVQIQYSDIGSGDDCVSIQTGCSNVHVHHLNCGPGHGTSIGGLGKDTSVACVSNIVVEDISMQNTLYGARIKTWQGGIGMVKNVSFSRIEVHEVKVPIVIDQYYCDKRSCKNQTASVVISGVRFDQIIGTYTLKPIHVACSNSIPCTNLAFSDIQLTPSLNYPRFHQVLCWNSYGKSQGTLLPSTIHYCLRDGDGDGDGSINRIASPTTTMCF